MGGQGSTRAFSATGWMADLKSRTVFVCTRSRILSLAAIPSAQSISILFHKYEQHTYRNFLVATDSLQYMKSLIIERAMYSICFPTLPSDCAL